MDLHRDDLEAARAFDTVRPIAGLEPHQRAEIFARAKAYRAWLGEHPRFHNATTAVLFTALFLADISALIVLPTLLLEQGMATLATAMLLGLVHGWLVCSIVTLSVHEGAAHGVLVLGRSRAARMLRLLTSNACRLFFADPEYYAAGHRSHHRHFGSERDGSFTNVVRPRRLALSLLPAAPVFSVSDYFPWRPREMTASRRLSKRLGEVTLLANLALVLALHGPVIAIVGVLMIGSWTSYALDRIRETLEHQLMPLHPEHGTRQLGFGFWGMLLGPGPWGQAFHLSHHLAPALPWYLQIRLHFDLRRILGAAQKQQLFVRPFAGVPRLVLAWLAFDRRRERSGGVR